MTLFSIKNPWMPDQLRLAAFPKTLSDQGTLGMRMRKNGEGPQGDKGFFTSIPELELQG